MSTQSAAHERLIQTPTIHFDDHPRARQSDPLTSHEAADATQSSVAASQTAVLEVLRSVMFPLSDAEIIHYVNREQIRFSESRIRTARHELVEDGIVVPAGTVKPEGARTRSTVWTLA